MTKAGEQASLQKSSLISFIEHSIAVDKTNDSSAELKLLSELKARRGIQRRQLSRSRNLRRERAKIRMQSHE